MKNCLLVVPLSFYSFSDQIKDSLTLMNYNVTQINDEYPANIVGKIMGTLHIPFIYFFTQKMISKKIIKGETYDFVLIIKGRGMSISLIDKFKSISPKVIGYNFDSFRYHNAPLNWYKNVTRYYTFDYRDAEKYSLPIIELFSSLPESLKTKQIKYSISAIMRNHSNRLEYLDKVLTLLKEDNVYIFIYEKDVFTFFLNFIKNPVLYLKYRKSISFKPLSYSKYVEVLHNSNFTIDYAHPWQSGITIRCFEALSCQTKIITNNPYNIKNSNFNETNNILFNDEIRPINLVEKYKSLFTITPKKVIRSRIDFIKELIS